MGGSGRNDRAFRSAAVVGLLHALASGYWAAGGSALVSTLGRWATDWRDRDPVMVALVLVAITLVKVAGAVLPLMIDRGLLDGQPLPHRGWRVLLWAAAILLVIYGAANVMGGVVGLIADDPRADRAALWGHAALWDPLFALWGTLLAHGLLRTRTALDGPVPMRY